MIKIIITKKYSPQFYDFSKKIWEIADMENYGRKINWEKENRFIQAYKNTTLVGLIELTLEAGVMHILDLVVDYTEQNQGIGTELMKKAEEVAKQNNIHKIFLETGATWKVRKFYEKLGYVKTGDLPKHFEKQDYVEYTKLLEL